MRLIDTHTHLNDQNFSLPIEQTIKNAQANGVEKIIVPGVDLESSHRAITLAEKYEQIYAAIGIHPHDVLMTDHDLDQAIIDIRKLAQGSDRVVAIGEVGIDYHHHDSAGTGAVQREAFVRQLLLAIELDLPAIVHGRKAYDEVVGVIKDFPGSRGVVHSFEADYEVAKKILDAGWLISLTALITYDGYNWLREVVAKLPLDRLMVETDSPYLPPKIVKTNDSHLGSRGRTNEPANVKLVAEQLATIKKISVEEVAETTTQTAQAFFKL
ncbi:TatD family hydrolase [Candidatus Berkelbacteria bacterium]|nr:TatD family hydrolase [Candidatus Berkelbacteria bacterium]